MAERRKSQRRYLAFYSRVFDRRTGRAIGYIVDLSTEGAMIISEDPIEPQIDFHLRMDLPESITNKAYIDFEARSVWCKRDTEPDFWGTGFKLTAISPEDINLIISMIREYGYQEE